MATEVIRPVSELVDRLRFEAILADLSSYFVTLKPAQVDYEIDGAQRQVCERLVRCDAATGRAT